MNAVLGTISILLLAVSASACSRSSEPPSGQPSASVEPTMRGAAPAVVSAEPTTRGVSAGTAPSGASPLTAPSGASPATIVGPNGASLRREAKYDTECNGKKAYTAHTRTPLPSTGCTGPMLVHFSMVHPVSGEVVDGETPVFCCP